MNKPWLPGHESSCLLSMHGFLCAQTSCSCTLQDVLRSFVVNRVVHIDLFLVTVKLSLFSIVGSIPQDMIRNDNNVAIAQTSSVSVQCANIKIFVLNSKVALRNGILWNGHKYTGVPRKWDEYVGQY